MSASDITLIEPPAVARPRESSVGKDALDAIQKQLGQTRQDGKPTWVTNGEVYKTEKLASNASQVYRRHVARHMSIPEKSVRSRVWDTSGKNDKANGQWVFALAKRTAEDKS